VFTGVAPVGATCRSYDWVIIGGMLRINEIEILDKHGVPDDLVQRAYRDLARIHRCLGDTRFIIRAICRDALPVRRVLDVGCGTGAVVNHVRRRLGVEAIGVDLHLHRSIAAPVPIFQADAVRDPLPFADVAFCMHLCHHLCEDDLVRIIGNVGRYCRRFILLDLVRHPLPLALFRLFVSPFVCPIVTEDGQRSIRRSYTPAELRGITTLALAGTAASFRHSVAPLYARQVIDISYADSRSAESTAMRRSGYESASRAS
jgi:SAM-dependent methyltransferase